MTRRLRRISYYVSLVVVTTVVFTVAYNVGMATWENRPQTVYHSLEIVFQTFTTTGYGEDAPWESPQMHVLVIGMQLAGLGLIFTGINVFAVPWLRNALTTAPPTAVRAITDHVIICKFTTRTDAFLTELESRDEEYVIIEPDREVATQLHKEERRVVHGAPESIDVLKNADIKTAKAVVADAADDTNASIVLSVRETNPDVHVVTLVEDEELAEYHRIAGADDVLSPRQLLGESLARQTPPVTVTTAIDENIKFGDDLQLVELSIEDGSELEHWTISEVQIRERFEATVIGMWIDGEFESSVDPETELDSGTILLVVGKPDQLDRLREWTTSTVRPVSARNVIIAGYGEAGAAARDALTETSSRVTILDIEERDGVDVRGDARDPEVLREAGVEDASTLILTVDDDTTAIFASLIARDLNTQVDIMVRANEQENVQKLSRAGADYVQSLATVSGQMIAATVFEDESILPYGQEIKIVTTSAGELAGQILEDVVVRAETGCTIVAVIRDGTLIIDFDSESFRLEEDDDVVVAGTSQNITQFEKQFAQ